MACDAILIQDGLDIPAEFHSIWRSFMEEGTHTWPSRHRDYREKTNGAQRFSTWECEM